MTRLKDPAGCQLGVALFEQRVIGGVKLNVVRFFERAFEARDGVSNLVLFGADPSGVDAERRVHKKHAEKSTEGSSCEG